MTKLYSLLSLVLFLLGTLVMGQTGKIPQDEKILRERPFDYYQEIIELEKKDKKDSLHEKYKKSLDYYLIRVDIGKLKLEELKVLDKGFKQLSKTPTYQYLNERRYEVLRGAIEDKIKDTENPGPYSY